MSANNENTRELQDIQKPLLLFKHLKTDLDKLKSQMSNFRPYSYCHRPIVVSDATTPLGEVIQKLRVHPEHSEDDVIDNDLILCWNTEKRIITGADLLGRLLRGIAGRKPQFVLPEHK